MIGKQNAEILSKELLGLAGEYAVASELCRHKVYAQLTLGHHKQTDILVETENRMLRISVKSKQDKSWPSVGGLHRNDDFLILVDFSGKPNPGRPDFYILNLDDWKKLVQETLQRAQGSTVDDQSQFTYRDGFKGMNIKPERVQDHKEQWDKITSITNSDKT